MKKALEVFGDRIPDVTVALLNREGAPTFRRNLEEQVIQVLTTNMLSNTFYVGQQQLTQETIEVLVAMRDKNPKFLAQAIVYARNEGFLQFVNMVALAILSTANDKRPFLNVFSRVVQTPDNLMEFVAICRSGKIRKGLGGVALQATKEWLNSLSEYHAVKYSGDSDGISLRDVLRMAHPKPKDKTQEERFAWLVKGWDEIGNDPSPSNPRIWHLERIKRNEDSEIVLKSINEGGLPWEAVVPSVKKMTTTTWEALMWQMPYTALMRHLNALSRAGVLAKPENVEYVANRLSDSKAVAQAKILPFRFFTAWKAYSKDPAHLREIADALETALEGSFVNMPEIPGVLAIGPDVSGSMISARVLTRPPRPDDKEDRDGTCAIEICGIFTAALMRKATGRLIVLPFEGHVRTDIRVDRSDRMLKTVETFSNINGRSTAVGAPIRFLYDRKIVVDTFVGITDNVEWDTSESGSFVEEWRRYKATVAPKAKAFLLTVASYRDAVAGQNEPAVHFVYGWSPDVVRYISATLSGKTQLQAVQAVGI
ncbi:MAG: TROVE domain-containing protein [bacterium]|nr:TROVE domain-containing protein [bacterium]